ncbi:MAG: Holliday junction resolvase RuvX [bacterium]|nr:Holliday junction resolvase RuvX [bacterium]
MRYLGLDLGTKTCGVALSDKTKTIASFYKNINYKEEDVLIKEICEIAEQEEVEKIILGFPKNMNNTIGERANATILFKEKLENKVNIPIVLEDERLTTKIAESTLIRENNLSRKKRKKIIDGTSAVIILQSYLDRRER